MTHTYLFALTDGGGTVPPELGVARRLLARGHRVTVLGEDVMAGEVAASGAVFRSWQHALNRPSRRADDAPYREWEIRDPRQAVRQALEHLVARPAGGYARDVMAAIQQSRPDLVVTSFFAVGAMIGAEAAGVPFDVLHPNIYPMPVRGMPPFGPGFQPARGPLGRARDRMVGRLSQRLWDRTTLPELNRVRAQYSLEPLDHVTQQVYAARAQLLLTSAAFDFPVQLPSSARYVGPVLDDPSWSDGQRWVPARSERPLVLVTMSSTFQNQAESLQRIVDALGRLPVHGLVTTGPALDPAELTGAPNVTVVGAAPHSEVLAHADLVVCHGGHGTLMKAFAAGLPVLVLHHGRDQADNAARVKYHGAGIALSRKARPARIARAVKRLLDDPRYGRAAEALGEAIRRDANSDALLSELEDLGTATDRNPKAAGAAPWAS